MNAQELTEVSAAIDRMFLAVKGTICPVEIMPCYLETLGDLNFDEFTAGILRARKKKASGFVPTDGEIYQEAMTARRQAFDARTAETTSRALPAIPGDPRKWPKVETAKVADLVESYEKAAELAIRNREQAIKELRGCMPGDPHIGNCRERMIKYASDRRHFQKLRDQYREKLDDDEELATPAAEERQLSRRAKRATDELEARK